MKLICTQNDLNANLSLVSRAVPARPSHPVLGNILLIADGEQQRLRLRGFDLSLGIETSLSASITKPGQIALPAKTLVDIVSRLPDGDLTLMKEEDEDEDDHPEGTLVTLMPTSGKYKLHSLDPAEFPELPTVKDGDSLRLPVGAMTQGLRSTLFAVSLDETKQVLTGVHVSISQDAIEFAATDGHRLAVVEIPNTDPEGAPEIVEKLAVTLPSRALRELERILGTLSEDESVTLHVDESQVVFDLGRDLKLTSRKLEGGYPDYQQLIPIQFANQVTLDRREFQSALERIAVIASTRNNVVRCEIDEPNQQIFLSVESQDMGSGRENLSAQVSSAEPTEIVFNVKYLMDGIKALVSNEVTVHLISPTQPALFKPLSGLKMTYLAMPIQLRD